jgi:hypothetical protein
MSFPSESYSVSPLLERTGPSADLMGECCGRKATIQAWENHYFSQFAWRPSLCCRSCLFGCSYAQQN